MPKKTRQQKIRADVRRTEQINASHFTFTASLTASPATTSAYNKNTQPDYLVKKDLIKTLLISIMFVTIEILLTVFSKRLGW